jgi:hypothetical protein
VARVCLMLMLVSVAAGALCCHADQVSDVLGTYTYAEDRSEDVNAAIDAGVAKLNFIVKLFARPRLRKTNYAYQRLTFVMDGDTLSIQMDDRKPIRAPISGTPVKWRRETGEWYDVTTSWENSVLSQSYIAGDGRRVNAFSLSEDGRLLNMQVTVSSPKLKDDIVYRLAYRRTDTSTQD